MQIDRPSVTAQRVALLRAAHQILDHPHVLDDPIAVRLVGEAGSAAVGSAPAQFETLEARGLRAFLVARSRFAEDELAGSVARGVRQYLVLGAGLDTFGCRNPHPGLQVFEVDHPNTQALKRTMLATAGIAIPDSLHMVSVDFESQSLAVRLEAAGYRIDEPAFCAWLGVTMYLSRDAVMRMLGFLATAIGDTGALTFDFMQDPAGVSPQMQAALKVLADRVAAAGEPLRSFFSTAALLDDLRSLGFSNARHIGQPLLQQRYFADRTDGLTVPYGNMILARR